MSKATHQLIRYKHGKQVHKPFITQVPYNFELQLGSKSLTSLIFVHDSNTDHQHLFVFVCHIFCMSIFHPKTLELMTYPGTVMQYRDGKIKKLSQVIINEVLFKNVSRGDRMKDSEVTALFPNMVNQEILELIVKMGELQVSAHERKEIIDNKRKELIQYIHKNYFDASNKLPLPIARIETALQNIKYVVDMNQSVNSQALELKSKLAGILTLKRHEYDATVIIPSHYITESSTIIHQFCTVRKRRLDEDGNSVFDIGVAMGGA